MAGHDGGEALRRVLAVGFGVFLATVIACGLNVEVTDRATEVVLDAASLPSQIEDARVQLDQRLNSSAVPDAAELAEREGLGAAFEDLEDAVDASRACTDGLQILLDRDKPSEGDKVIGLTRRCQTLLGAIHDQIDTPLRTLERWESLLSPENTEAAQAKIRAEDALAALATVRAMAGDLEAARRAHPYKAEDLQTRYDDLVNATPDLKAHYASLEASPDIATLANAIDGVEDIAAALTFGADDLGTRIATLDDTTAMVLTRLERAPQYWIRVQNWSWTSSTSGDGTMTDLGWQLTNRDVYEQAVNGDGVVLEYSGDEEYGGSSTEVTDWDIAFATFATTFTRTNDDRTEPVRAEIDPDTFWDLYFGTRGLAGVFPDEGLILEELSAGFTDDDGIPYELDLAVLMAMEQKFAGQYFDDASEVPALDGTPLSIIGNEDFGAWESDVWVFTPAFLAYWKAGDWYKSASAERFLTGYSRAEYAKYAEWRRSAGWGEQYDEDGTYLPRRFRIGSYLFLSRFGSHSVRGAGPSARSRGLGGGK